MADNEQVRIYSADELRAICPMLRILHQLGLIGLVSVRMAGYIDWGSEGYIITSYDRL
jgi:hypothetical protein